MSSQIGFIGTGIMGGPMAANVMAAGYPVMVYNRTATKTEPLEEAGARTGATPRAVSQWADIVIMMVTGPAAVDEVLAGPDGMLAADRMAQVVVNMSTVSPSYSQRLDEQLHVRGSRLIEAPVSGSKKAAEDAALVVLAGGPEREIAGLEPLLLTMGKTVVYCGDIPCGAHMKLSINLLLGIVMEGLCEAVTFGEKSGLSAESILEAVSAGAMNCPLFSLKSDMLKQDAYPPQFPLKHMAKDIRFVLQAAAESEAAIPAGQVVFQLFRQGLEQGLGDLDVAAVKQVLGKMSH